MYVKPKKGLKVREPGSMRHLPEEGKEVQDSPYWRRRIRSGDVEEVKPEPGTAPEPKAVRAEPIPPLTKR